MPWITLHGWNDYNKDMPSAEVDIQTEHVQSMRSLRNAERQGSRPWERARTEVVLNMHGYLVQEPIEAIRSLILNAG